MQGAQQACADEIELTLGSGVWSGQVRMEGALAGPGPFEGGKGARPVAARSGETWRGSAWRGGVRIAELASAVMIAHARDAPPRDPVVRALLDRIAEQELLPTRRLVLGVTFAGRSKQGDETLRSTVAQVFERVEQHVAFGARIAAPRLSGGHCAARARLSLGERASSHASMVLEEVVRPAVRALFAGNALCQSRAGVA